MINIDDRLIKETLPVIKPNGLAVLLVISIHLNKESGTCFPSHERLMKMTGLGSESVYNALKALKKEGLLISAQSVDSKSKTFSRRTFKLNTNYIGIWVAAKNANPIQEEPLTDLPDAAKPHTAEPDAAKHETYLLNELEQLNKLEQLNNVGVDTPAPAENFNNLEEEKNENGLVAPPPAEIQRPDPHQSQGQMIGPIVEYIASNPSDIKVTYPPAEASAPGCPYCAAGITHKAGEGCDPTHIVRTTGPGSPGVMEVEGIALAPNPRVATTIEAEKRISDWIVGEGLETVRFRYETAKERFDPQQAQAISAHYCSVYTKNPANKERLLKDPVTHFSDGLFAYIKSEQQYGRHRPQPSASAQTTQSPAVLTPSQYRRLT